MACGKISLRGKVGRPVRTGSREREAREESSKKARVFHKFGCEGKQRESGSQMGI